MTNMTSADYEAWKKRESSLIALHKKHHMRPEFMKFDGKVYQNVGWSNKKIDMENAARNLKDKYYTRIVSESNGGWVLYTRSK